MPFQACCLLGQLLIPWQFLPSFHQQAQVSAVGKYILVLYLLPVFFSNQIHIYCWAPIQVSIFLICLSVLAFFPYPSLDHAPAHLPSRKSLVSQSAGALKRSVFLLPYHWTCWSSPSSHGFSGQSWLHAVHCTWNHLAGTCHFF